MDYGVTLVANLNLDEHEGKERFVIEEKKQCNKPTKLIQVFRNEEVSQTRFIFYLCMIYDLTLVLEL